MAGDGHRSSGQSTPPYDADTAVIGGPAEADSNPAKAGFGRYVVVEEIGRGAMGRVLRAYDPKLQREVALKEVRRVGVGTAGASRLVAEARAMAKLAHPNVVAVYDVEEVVRGRVVLAMEYVRGQTLRQWLETPRSWQEIVARFREAGEGLAAAHAAGLLHRDFKPDNVLVADDDAVKVTDFGLAKADSVDTPSMLDEQVTDSAAERLTQTGVVLGTPRYMAPEQHRGDPLSPAADQYAYCVALWEALTGAPPFGGQRIEATKAQGPPPWPAGPTPRPVAEAVARGLAVAPTDRWPEMHALLRALAYDPAERRRRWLGAMTGVGVVAIGAAGTWAWTHARAQRCTLEAAATHLEGVWDPERREEVRTAVLAFDTAYARAAWSQSVPRIDAYADAWTGMHVEACEATSVRGDASAATLDLRMACLQRARIELAAVSDVLADADAKSVEQTHALVASLPPLERCADVEALHADVEPPLPEEADAVAELRARLGATRAARVAYRKEQAMTELDAAKAILPSVSYAPVQVEVALEEGRVLMVFGDHAAAEAALRDALTSATAQQQWAAMREAASNLLFVVGYRQQRFDAAWSYAELARGLADADPKQEADVITSVATVLDAQGKYAEAEAEHRRALALREQVLRLDDPEIAQTRVNIAKTLLERGEYQAAEVELRSAIAALETSVGADHIKVVNARGNLASVLLQQRRYEEAEPEFQTVLALYEQSFGPDHPTCGQTRASLALVLGHQGKDAEAEAELRRGIDVLVKALGSDHPQVAGSRSNLALMLAKQGKLREAEAEQRHVIAVQEKTIGPEHPDFALSTFNLGEFLQAQGQLAEAEAETRRAVALIERAFGADHAYVPRARIGLARLLLLRGALEEARTMAEDVWARVERDEDLAPHRPFTMYVLARVRWAAGDAAARRAAIALAREAVDAFAASGSESTDEAIEAKAWLDGLDRP